MILDGASPNQGAGCNSSSQDAGGGAATLLPTLSETGDCLSLDVFVPEKVLPMPGAHCSAGAPVLVWIHGGDYTVGSKTSYDVPGDLLGRSRMNSPKGLIFVSINYCMSPSRTFLRSDANSNCLARCVRVFWRPWSRRGLCGQRGDSRSTAHARMGTGQDPPLRR